MSAKLRSPDEFVRFLPFAGASTESFLALEELMSVLEELPRNALARLSISKLEDGWRKIPAIAAS
jgi:hypothetical protein